MFQFGRRRIDSYTALERDKYRQTHESGDFGEDLGDEGEDVFTDTEVEQTGESSEANGKKSTNFH